LLHLRPSRLLPTDAYLPLTASVEVNSLIVRDQVIRENPANRGTEASAEELVGPPWRM
jgi:hypothetical protein